MHLLRIVALALALSVLAATAAASQEDPGWELYVSSQDDDVQILLHKVDGSWTVVAQSNDKLDPQKYGAPADLTFMS